mmetsp:Transcript_23421/g.17869  ORF Transcript_23421/g.17869 Transcript_23421/m.17869 type:complete len:90 (+) Transcript_23421:1041-1310(+)
MHSNFGFGIGTGFKEEALLINETNDTIVEPGMTFHVRVSFTEVSDKPERSVVALGETVVVDQEPRILTAKLQRKWNEVSYQLEDKEEAK